MESIDDVEELLLTCECSGYHYIQFWYDKDFGVNIAFIEQPKDFREKIKAIWDILRNKTIYDGDLIVKKKDQKNLAKVLKKLL